MGISLRQPYARWRHGCQSDKIGAVKGVDCCGTAVMVEMKHQVVHVLQKHVLNPPIKLFVCPRICAARICAPRNYRFRDRKTRRTPVGDALVGRQFWIVTEHGMKAGYVRNIEATHAYGQNCVKVFAPAGIRVRPCSER